MHRIAEVDDFARPAAATLVDLLRGHASMIGDKQAFRFVRDQAGDDLSISYRQLHVRAMAIGGELQGRLAPGEAALLLYPPGLDFISAFFGCLYAGVAAVPAALPTRNRGTSSIGAIAKASQAALVLSTADQCETAERSYTHLPELLERPWLATDRIPDDRQSAWRDPQVDAAQTAFLQYTSGSTSSPKGVMLSHANLLHNASVIQRAFGNTPRGHGVSWLPLYHDMGLIGGVVQPIYCGGPCTLLAPVAFLQRPAFWLETISRMRATVSGGPDFAYDLCVRKISAEERKDLDLSRWTVAFTGAERVRAETIERFAEAFAPCGFRREAFFPCYGLAEATLMVSGGPRLTPPTIVRVSAEALGRNQVQQAGGDAKDAETASRRFVGCGACLSGQTVAIVDVRTRRQCEDGRIGEIWVQGPSVAGGYHRQPEATEAAFAARLDTGEGPFLRTGDLGFLHGGQLFITGRLKDVIIIRGRNYYPEDIEHSFHGAHPAFRAGYCAAFSVEVQDRERLVVVQEIEPRRRELDAEAALQAVRAAIAAQHELEVYGIVLVKAGEVPKTSSGKTQRSACRERYLNGHLEIVAQWRAALDAVDDDAWVDRDATCARIVTADEIEGWLIQWIAARAGLPAAQVRVATPFLEFGLGSVDAVNIATELERRLGRQLSPTALYNHPTISALARWLAAPAHEEDPCAKVAHARIAVQGPAADQFLVDVQNMTQEDMEAFILQEMAKQSASQ
jgi:acyl-CoA synthetase (AMP-forming)/AMP-acid ligase II/acyl carrier protein